MVNAERAFAAEPPLEPLTHLSAVVRDFRWRYLARGKTDQVVEFCKEADSFAQAVRRACESRDANGKHHNHQSKVDITARRKFAASIISRRSKIMAIKEQASDPSKWLPNFTPFDKLYDLFDQVKPYGIGPVTTYDVAVRVGAYLGIEPEQLYMHAGVRKGLQALGLGEVARMDRIPRYRWPSTLQSEPADVVEDILCTYREVFLTWQE